MQVKAAWTVDGAADEFNFENATGRSSSDHPSRYSTARIGSEGSSVSMEKALALLVRAILLAKHVLSTVMMHKEDIDLLHVP